MIVITPTGSRIELRPDQLSVLDRAHCFKVLRRMARYRTLSLVRENTLTWWPHAPTHPIAKVSRGAASLAAAILVAPIVERCALGLTWADWPPRLP